MSKERNDKKPVVLFLAEGIGLSDSQLGNVIKLSGGKEFLRIWQSYLHYILHYKNNKKKFLSHKEALCKFVTGLNYDEKDILDKNFRIKKLKDRSLNINRKLVDIFDNVKSHQSTLHLIGDIGSLEELEIILQLLKINRLSTVVIHFLVKEAGNISYDKFLRVIDQIEKLLKSYDTVRVATISPYYEGINDLDILASIIGGRNKKYLTLKQMVARAKKLSFKQFLFSPSGFCKNDDRNATVSEFDSVIFFDSDVSSISTLVNSFDQNLYRSSIVTPKFVRVLTFFDFASRKPKINYCFSEKEANSLISKIANKGYKTLAITSVTKKDFLGYWLDFQDDRNFNCIVEDGLSSPDNFQRNLDKYYRSIISSLDDGNDFTVILYPDLSLICNKERRILEIVKYYLIFDRFLADLEKLIIEENAVLIFSSPYGMIEQLSECLLKNGKMSASRSFLPLSIISNDTKSLKRELMIEALTQKPTDISFLRNKLEKYFEV